MMEIERPQIAVEESADLRVGKFIVEPLERGHGITLGNSLRRVLMSALPGAAIVGIRIEGVSHEFSTIKGVREDVAEIIQNLKDLNLRADYTDKQIEKVLRLEASEAGVVRASQIQLDPEVEILNPDMPICTLDNGGKLVMDLRVGLGRGYVVAEHQKADNQPIGYIAIDSKFSPVKMASYSVESTRVGQSIDYDKLTLEIKTDGSITAKDALSLAAKVLSEHVNMFVTLSKFMADKAGIIVEPEPDKKTQVLKMTIEELDLSVRSFNCLKRASIHTVEDLIKKSEDDMLKVRNLGRKSLDEVIAKLRSFQLELRRGEEII